MARIALSIISKGKGEEDKLDRALSSIYKHVDGIFVTLTEPRNLLKKAEDVCAKYGAIVSYEEAKWTADQKAVDWLKEFFGYEPNVKLGDKLFLFDKARNFNLSQITKDFAWFVWMDTDDVFIGGERLHDLADLSDKNNVEAVYFNYIYQAELDEQGNIKYRIIEHLRERLVRNNDHYKWISPIHETLIEQVPTRKTDVPDCEVLHLSTDRDRNDSLLRNLANLELAIYQTDGKDPRHIYYLAKVYYDMHTPEADNRAIALVRRYIEGDANGDHKSGWPEERMQAWNYLSELYRRINEHPNSMKSALNAMTEPCMPTPEVFLNLSMAHLINGQPKLALYWVKNAAGLPNEKSTLVRNEKDVQVKILEIIFNASVQLSKVDDAYAAAKKLIDMLPDEQTARDAFKFASELKEQRDMSMNVVRIAHHLETTGQHEKLQPLLAATPAIAQQTPFFAEMVRKITPPRIWADNEIAIFCGPGVTDWTPKQMIDPKASFIGGSEEAVIKLGKALTKQGYKVTVFNSPGPDEGNHDGVDYLSYVRFNPHDHYNIIVGWRQFPPSVKSKKRYFWAHDVIDSLQFPNEKLDEIDKVIVLSDYHRSLIPRIPDDKILLSSNGI